MPLTRFRPGQDKIRDACLCWLGTGRMTQTERPPNNSEQADRPLRRSWFEWASIGVLAAFTLAVIYAWGSAAWWIVSMALRGIG